jgi:hypothetical protein
MKQRGGPAFTVAICFFSMLAVAGCRSRFVQTTIVNKASGAMHLLEFDYPSASFGKQMLDSQSEFHYRFKVQGSGPVKLEYTDDRGIVHTSPGPQLNEGDEGSLTFILGADGSVSWTKNLRQPD